MSDAADLLRSANLLGALALIVSGRVEAGVTTVTGRPAADAKALVLMTTVLDGRSQEAVAGALNLSQSGTVRLVDRLAREGLVERGQGRDGRTVAVRLTADGERTAGRALERRQSILTESLAALAPEERAQLTTLLEKLLAGLVRSGVQPIRVCQLCDPHACGHFTGQCPVTDARHPEEPDEGSSGHAQ